ncbi:MAG: TIGR02757 family protein [Planctomycetes bacterium]|nr:TIGR02757 family protein [Planctomycetota bacterium]
MRKDSDRSDRNIQTVLEEYYGCYNTQKFIASDPVSIVHEYSGKREREVVAILVSSLAYGRVQSILNSSQDLLERLGGDPADFLLRHNQRQIEAACKGFRHRFTGQETIRNLLCGIKRILHGHSSLEHCMRSQICTSNNELLPAINGFVEELTGFREGIPHLFPAPRKGSACKRLNLFFRWMVRDDAVDPGGWKQPDPKDLLIPLDVHMMRVCHLLGLTKRKNPDLKATLEVTAAFRKICPEDPVRYDFALTRAAMLEGMESIAERFGRRTFRG